MSDPRRSYVLIALFTVAIVGIPVIVASFDSGSTIAAVLLSGAAAVLLAYLRGESVQRAMKRSSFQNATENELEKNAIRKELAEAREESGVREEILSAMDEGVVLADPSGSVLYANASARLMLGITIGSKLPPSISETTTELTVHHPVRRELRATNVTLEDGRRIVALLDVTEMRRVEKMRRDFVGDASHELKTPVAAILATAETVESAAHDDPAAVTRFVGTLVHEARRLSRLVQDLLDLARLEQQAPLQDRVNLSEIVQRESEAATSRAAEKQIQLTTAIAPDVKVQGSEQDLALATRNLLDNAVRYTNQGTITVALEIDGADVAVSITDTGRGIPAKDIPRIFERFYRVDEARSRETGGTGLGLAIVKHVAERHGGSVKASSELGRGSSFELRLPASR
ncbi:MAG: ATP-binding protein [Actinomycetota bacterium]